MIRRGPARHTKTKFNSASARRGNAEAERQRQLREQYGWYGAMQHARLEREARAKAEAEGKAEDND